MTTYGDTQEPGIVTDLTSSAAVSTSGEAPSDVGYVGQADLSNATSPADTSTVYQVTRASKAVEWFGPTESSLLTNAIIDALNEGAYPVYAVAAAESSISSEDHSGVGTTTVSLDEGPLREDASTVEVNLDDTLQSPTIVYDDVSGYSPDPGEAYVNPVDAEVEVNSVPSSLLTVSYQSFDYESGIDVLTDNAPDVIDYLLPLSEKASVADYANVAVANMESEYDLALAQVGAGIDVDPTGYTQDYDDSRTQTVYPTRFEDGTSALAAYVGMKAGLGLGETPINKRLTTNKRLSTSLNRAERGSLGDASVVVLSDESRGVRVTDDPTTVSESNTDERNLNYGFNRLVADYIIETTRDNQRPFIGKLNSQTIRNTLEGMVDDSLTELQESNVVVSYDVNILKEDAVSAGLEMSVELVKPLRFIENTVTVE
jgi:Phage tail sheath protein.